jgi:hypothetical protein
MSVSLDKGTAFRSPTTLAIGEAPIVQSFLTIKTEVGHGNGSVKLANNNSKWKEFTLFTFLEGLRGYGELTRKESQVVQSIGSISLQKELA